MLSLSLNRVTVARGLRLGALASLLASAVGLAILLAGASVDSCDTPNGDSLATGVAYLLELGALALVPFGFFGNIWAVWAGLRDPEVGPGKALLGILASVAAVCMVGGSFVAALVMYSCWE